MTLSILRLIDCRFIIIIIITVINNVSNMDCLCVANIPTSISAGTILGNVSAWKFLPGNVVAETGKCRHR